MLFYLKLIGILHNTYCILHTAYCILHTAYCILHTAYCILLTVNYSMLKIIGRSRKICQNLHWLAFVIQFIICK
jgi:hypothetical protein